jgi:hypothetical protein
MGQVNTIMNLVKSTETCSQIYPSTEKREVVRRISLSFTMEWLGQHTWTLVLDGSISQ